MPTPLVTAAEMAQFQSEAEARMTDTCLVTAPGTGARGPINPTTLKYDAAPAGVTVYDGPCRLGRIDIPHMAQAAGGAATWDVQDSVLHLPLEGSESVVAGCTVDYVSSSVNPALEGRRFGVLAIVGGTNVTARRCLVREVVAD